MRRSLHWFMPCAAAWALFSGCGGVSDRGIFSGSSHGGTSAAGSANHAGAPAALGGDDDSSAGLGDSAGDASGGANSAGSGNAAGTASGGNGGGSGGGGAPGAGAGGAPAAGAGGVPGAGAGGVAVGGAGAAGFAGGVALGGSGGRAAGRGAGGSSAGAAGSGSELTCQQLFSLASTELEAARACSLFSKVEQCTGKVKTTCNCDAAVESNSSPETVAYLATLKQISAKKCVQLCPAIACLNVTRGMCSASTFGSTTGACVNQFGATL